MDLALKLGEDSELGYRLAECGAVFVPDREARSWHLGRTHVMRRQDEVNDYNFPFLADRIPDGRVKRATAGRQYAVPYLEVVLDTHDRPHGDVVATVDAVLASTIPDLVVTLLGPWSSLTDERVAVLDDPCLDARLVHASYASEPRVRLVERLPDGRSPAMFRLTLSSATWAPKPKALNRMVRELEWTHHGLRSALMPDGATARLERTAAVQRALRVRRPDEDLDDVVDSLFGCWWVDGPEVGFAPSATVTVARLPGRSGAAQDPAGLPETEGGADAGCRPRHPSRPRRDPPYAACWRRCATGCDQAVAMADSLQTFLAAAPPSTLVVVGEGAADLVPAGPAAREEPWDLALVVVRDRLDLRALASGLSSGLGASTPGARVASRCGSRRVRRCSRVRAGSLPPMTGTRSRRLPDGSWLSVLRFGSPVSIGRVLKEVARQAVRGDDAGDDGLWADGVPSPPDAEVPVGVVLADGPEGAAVHPVLGRAPVMLAEPDPVPILDERVLNPRGFRAGTAGRVVPLPEGATLTEALAANLREAASVPVTWPDATRPGSTTGSCAPSPGWRCPASCSPATRCPTVPPPRWAPTSSPR